MKKFLSLEDVERAALPEDLRHVVRGTLAGLIRAYEEVGETFDPETDGHTVLVEQGDDDDTVREAIGGYTLRDAPFEGCVYERGCFVTCVLFNNQFGISIVVSDQPSLDAAVRERLMADL